MSTDRSLWVEDKYALRCRGCSEKFTVFRRRHHCRRCGQVFCHECLNPPPTAAASAQLSIVANVYQWFAPPPTTSGVPAELAMRLCRRCAATITENAAREASDPPGEFRPSSHTLGRGARHASVTSSPLMLSASLPCPSPARLDALSRQGVRSLPSEAPTPVRRLAVEDSPDAAAPAALCSAVAKHAETAEEREVTYSIGRVRRPASSSSILSQWWTTHPASLKGVRDKRAGAGPRPGASCACSLEAAGALVRDLSTPVDFRARFFLADEVAQPSSQELDGSAVGSAAVLAIADAPALVREFLGDFGAACTTHLETRIRHALRVASPSTRGARLSGHLADLAWHVVRHTAVALGASVFDHTSIFSVPAPALPAQCAVYPGLVNRRRLPSKRLVCPCDNARVLLLAGHLSYPVQPAEDLVDYVRSYSGYLDKLFQRLVVWHPDVIVVEGGMHHYLRERIEEEGQMRLVLDVGRDFLVQLSWCLHADIIADLQYVGVGDLATTAPLGHCARFEVLELADEVHCCGFRGFNAVSFHTLLLRGGRLGGSGSSSSSSDSGSVGVRQWEVVERVAKEAVGVAYHLALQAHGAAVLVRDGVPLARTDGSTVAEEAVNAAAAAAAAAAITMNVGCHFPDAVQSACRAAAGPDALSALKDNIVVNIVRMDQLFAGGGAAGGGSSGGTGAGGGGAAGGAGGAGGPSSGSRSAAVAAAASAVMGTLTKSRSSELSLDRGNARASLATSRGSSHLEVAASGAAATPSTTSSPLGRMEPPAPSSYAVVQQKAALPFYGAGDESLFHFLVNRCTGTQTQVLYLHGAHRVKATTSTRSPLTSASTVLRDNVDAGVLGVAQAAAFHRATAQQNAARALGTAELVDVAATTAFMAHLRGFFSLRICADGGASGNDGAALVAAEDVCSPHLLNISTAAFIEWVLYGWMPALVRHFAQPRLLIQFQFHPLDPAAAAAAAAAAPRVQTGEGTGTAYANAVTLLVEAVPVCRVEYPPPVLPHADEVDAAAAVDARGDAADVEALLSELKEAAKSCTTTTTTTTTTNGAEEVRLAAEDAQRVLVALEDARQRGPVETEALLADWRRGRVPALVGAYRAWHVAQRKAAVKGMGEAAAAAATERPASLRRFDGCLYHADRPQWVRLAEPSSVLAAALLQLYQPVAAHSPPTTPQAAVSQPRDSELDEAAAPPPTGTSHVSFSIEASPPAPPPAPSLSGRLSPAAALQMLRQSSRIETAGPTSVKCTLSGYHPVLHPSSSNGTGSSGTGGGGGGNTTGGSCGGGGASGEPTITVEVLFPRGFAALQVLYTDAAPMDIVAALQRCRPYSTDGGKSQSRFFVTHDGRFLVKSVKPMEMRHFREWAPRYFARMADYYASAQQHQATQPCDADSNAHLVAAQSALGKVLGLYAVHVQGSRGRSPALPSAFSSDAAAPLRGQLADGTHCFMVAEQLLFQRPVRETWDLKGSQRNRTTEQTAAVRLDVDLVQERLRLGNFFFCTPEAKSLLMDHLSRDTAVLADSGIMDYSLMVSVGDGRVCVGMIDFLHPYSSAKVLESKMKSGLDTMLGYTRRDPTIIDPASYAARFMLWMDGYFNGVPDRLFPLTRARLLKERRESGLAEKHGSAPPTE